MSTFIIFWIIIGLGNWASHTMTCRHCTDASRLVISFFLHAVVQISLWPFSLYEWIFDNKNQTVEYTGIDDASDIVAKGIIKREPNESDEQFAARALKDIQEQIKIRMEKLRK